MTYHDFAAQCHQELHTLQDEMHSRYKINGYANWYYDQHTGLFTFSTGEEELNFRYAEVGSLSEKSNTWMWAWHNDSVLAKARKPAETIKQYGETYGFEPLTTGVFEADEYDAWEFAGIALKLLGGIGVYRPYSDNLKKFVILLEVVGNRDFPTRQLHSV
jgi:hypothetical protein